MINTKILIVCGHGLGNSFMVEMSAQETFRRLDTPSDIEAEHSDIMAASPEITNLFIYGGDLAENAECLGDVLVLDNILNKAELQQKLSGKLQQLNMV